MRPQDRKDAASRALPQQFFFAVTSVGLESEVAAFTQWHAQSNRLRGTAPWGHIKDSRQEQAVDQRVDQRMIRSPQSLAPTLKNE
jgi:hypothetical protein